MERFCKQFSRNDNSTELSGKRDAKRVKKGSNSEKVSERLPFKFVPESQGRTTEFKTLFCDFCTNATIKLHSGKFYEPAILSVHETPKVALKLKTLKNYGKALQTKFGTFIKTFSSGDIKKNVWQSQGQFVRLWRMTENRRKSEKEITLYSPANKRYQTWKIWWIGI